MRVAARVCLMVTSAVTVARAEPLTRCSGPELILDPPLSARRPWSQAAGDARRRVAELSDVDACAKLEVEQTRHAVRVRASSSDGRSVVRDLSGPSELEATVVALLVLPPPSAEPGVSPADAKPAPAAPKPAAAPAAPKPASSTHADSGVESNAGLGKSAGRGSAFEAALGAGARSASYLMGPGVRSVLDAQLGDWLLGGVIHAEQLSAVSPSTNRFSMERSGSVGALFGRRLLRSPFYLDVAVEAPVLTVSTSRWDAQTQTPGAVQTPEPGENENENETDDPGATTTTTTTSTKVVSPHADLRGGGFIRAVYPFRGAFGMFAELDAEHTLGLVKQPSAEGQPPVVAWSVGLSLGLFWSSR
ncbi:MAG TPA: hypothetical protein VGQ57_15930 [Polyangiaceae bacterium]|jgi:hypothetical protein|nr:hypothetical protein [Polyangiaceae bacterium]